MNSHEGYAHIDTGRAFRRMRWPERALREIRRAVLLLIFRGELACLKAERENYQAAIRPGSGITLGPQYLKNAALEQRRLEGRIAFLEARIDY